MSVPFAHALYTPAVEQSFPGFRKPVPVGAQVAPGPTSGSLLFVSDETGNLKRYAIYHTDSNYGMGPFHQAYVHYGRVDAFYGIWPNTPYVVADWPNIHGLCGEGSSIMELFAFSSVEGGVDLYVRTVEQEPADVYQRYKVDVGHPDDWWRARSYTFVGASAWPGWSEPMARL